MLWSIAVATWLSPAKADDKSECVAAYSDAQDLRLAGKLSLSHERLRVCAREVCPAFIAHDCAGWMSEVEATTPSVIVIAKDAAGRDLSDVHVVLDGAEIRKAIDGEAISVDPGAHTFVFTREGSTSVSRDIVLRIGEKNRQIIVTFGPVAEPLMTPPPTSPTPAAPSPNTSMTSPSPEPLAPRGERHTGRTLGYAIGAAGVLGLLGGGTLGLVAVSTKSARCGSDNVCEPHTLGLLRTEATISTVGLIAGTAFAAGGVALVVFGDKPERAALWISPFATGKGIDLAGSF